ncbi:hypothetical protein ACJ3XI_03150 [Litorimonas sp. RW-G-Af-16]|uniref:hypothetical protein n=1 Tax=Litorimonas sp. RW-G-Af-16 TaxID=3241168 RepID=UPI00390CBFCA
MPALIYGKRALQGDPASVEFVEAIMSYNLVYFVGGIVFAGLWIMAGEGVFHHLADWASRNIRPLKGRTQQSYINHVATQPTRPYTAPTSYGNTLVGTSTNYLRDHDLDLRTQTLIKLSYYACSQANNALLSTLEKTQNCAYGQRQKNFQTLISSISTRPNLKQIIRPFKKAESHHVRAMMSLFTELCELARVSRNTDDATMGRLIKIGRVLGLSDEDMGTAIHQLG